MVSEPVIQQITQRRSPTNAHLPPPPRPPLEEAQIKRRADNGTKRAARHIAQVILPFVSEAALPLRPVPAPVLVALCQALRGEVASGFDFFSKAGMGRSGSAAWAMMGRIICVICQVARSILSSERRLI